VAGVITVTPISDPVTVTAASYTISYGTATPTINDIFNGLRPIDTTINTTSASGPITCSTTYVTGDAPGNYPTTCTGPSSVTDYASILYVAGNLTVTTVTSPVTITASSTTISYGDATPTLSGSATGLVNGDTVTSLGVTCQTTYVPGDNAGTYPSSCSGGSSTDYSDITYVNGAVVIHAVATTVTVTASSATITYGAPAPTPTPSFSGLVFGTSIPGVTCSNSYVAGQGLGSYATSCTGPLSNVNYTSITYVAGSLSVGTVSSTLTITASSPTVKFGAPVPTISSSVTGLVNGDTASVVTGTTCATTYVVGDDAGTYPTSCTNASSPNYSVITYAPGVLTVSAVTTPLTITASSTSIVFGASAPAVSASFAGLAYGTSIGGVTCSSTYVTGDDAGTYASSCTGPSSTADYATITYVTGVITVTPVTATLTVTANSPTISYGSAAPTINASYAGLVYGTSLAGMVCTSTYVVGDDPGTYQTSCSVSTPDYTAITYVTGLVTVTQVTSTVTVTASSATVIFGGSAPTITPQYSGLAFGSSIGGVTCSTSYSVGSTGTSTTSCTGPASNTYYSNITYVNGTLSVASSTGPVTITASSTSITYGDAAPTISASYAGLVYGTSISGITCTTQYVAGDGPGIYTSSCSGSSSAYSSLTFIQGTVTVTPVTAQVTITASSPSITYGAPASTPSATYVGLVNSDTAIAGVACTSTYVAGDSAGTYPTSCAGASTIDYSNIVYVSGTMTVLPVATAVTVTGLSASITVTDPVPSNLLLSVTGLVNGDTASSISAVCSTTYTATSPGGSYPVTCSAASSSNYSDIVYVAGSLTVTPTTDPVTVTAASSTITYGASSPTISDIFNGVGMVDTNITGVTCQTAYVQGDAPGAYATTCTGPSSNSYYTTINYVAGSLTVTPISAPVTVTAASQSVTYGDAVPTLPAPATTGLVNGDTAVSLGITCTTSYLQGSDVGTYPTMCSGASTTDYTDINYLDGTLTVSPVTATVVVTASSPSINYGDAAPTPTALYSGLTYASSLAGVVCSNSFVAGEGPGTYDTTCTGPSSTIDYTSITYATGSLTVTSDSDPVTLTAPSLNVTYGDAVPTLPSPATTGLVNGDTAVSLGITCTTSYVVGDAPGTYATSCALPNTVTQYSNVAVVTGLITVAQSTTPVVVTASTSPSTITAGDAVPTLHAAATGLLGTDTPTSLGVTCTTTYTTSSPSGIYAVNCSGPSSNADYSTINYVSGNLDVNAAPTTPPGGSSGGSSSGGPPSGTPSTATSITTTALANAVVNQVYSATLSSSGGTGLATTWAASGLPAGLTLSPTGVLTGTPTAAGTYVITFTATVSGVSVSKTLVLIVTSGAGGIDPVGNVSVLAGDSQVLVRFTPPTNVASFTGVTYTVSASPGNASCVTTSTTCLVTELNNGTTYTFSVVATATSPVGASTAVLSSSATPTAAAIVAGSNGKGTINTAPPRELTPGAGSVTPLNGEVVKATVAVSNTSVTVSGEGDTMSIVAASTVSTPSGFTIELVQGGIAVVRGTGFLPGTLVDVYIYSQQYLLGTATVNSHGTYAGNFRIPATLAVGNHTVLSQGFVKSGARASISLGVVVESMHQSEITLFPYAIGSAALTPTMIQELSTFALLIRRSGATKVVVSGFTDIKGNPASNLALGEQRATTAAYLLRQFLDRDHVNVSNIHFVLRSLGSTAPAASNATLAGQARNRNVTVVATLK
jgi:outer membrane protein OmpA-like peptidoglycan-associated protein